MKGAPARRSRLTAGPRGARIRPPMPMRVTLNGEQRELPDALTVAGLLGHLQIKAARVAVEVNESVVTKDRYEAHRISPGDSIEIVAFVGGG